MTFWEEIEKNIVEYSENNRKQLDLEIFNTLKQDFNLRLFKNGHLLWSEGDTNGMMVYLISGRIKIYRLLPTGKAITLYIFDKNTLFGFMPFFDGEPYPAYAQALGDCEAYVMYRSSLTAIVKKKPETAVTLLRHLSLRLRQSFDRIEKLSSKGTLPKVASALYTLISDDKNSDDVIIIKLPIISNEFAQSLGISPETFSRNISTLVEKGFIKRLKPNQFQILDINALKSFSNLSLF